MFLRCFAGVLALITAAPTWASSVPSIFVYNQTQGQIIANSQEQTVRPIASITKLMTAMIVLDSRADLSEVVPLDRKVRGSLPRGSYTRRDLLAAMLVKSDNSAAETLAEHHPGGRASFIKDMNIKSRQLGLTLTQFADPSGLSAGNISTAQEVAQLVHQANGYWVIQQISTQPQVSLATGRRHVAVSNTNNRLLQVFPHSVIISKTGFTVPAGYCMSLLVENHGQQFVIVVLGERSKWTRLTEVKRIMQHYVL